MNERYESILNNVRMQYPESNFGIIEEYRRISFIYDNTDLIDNEIFFNFVCDVAYEHLVDKELNIFSIVYDYYSELVTTNIITEINNISRYVCKDNSDHFYFNFDNTQSLIDINEGVFAA